MAITNTLVGKSLLGVGVGGATISGGGWIIFSPTSPLWIPRGSFEERTSKLMKHVGFEEKWCTIDDSKTKYTCDKSKSKENLKKLNFYSKDKIGSNLKIFDDYENIEVVISETSDDYVFPFGVKFVFKNTDNEIKIREIKDGSAINSFQKKIYPEFKAVWGINKLRWAWEDINNLAGKNEFGCSGDSCTFQTKKLIHIKRKNDKKTVYAAIDRDKKLKFTGNQSSSYFQGYKFYVEEDIDLKNASGGPLPTGTSITKFEKDKSYQITSDEKGAWYFIDV